MKILRDNSTEFKNKIFEQVAKELGVMYKLYTPPNHPASNGRIEGFHAFLKACISKHIAPQLEWDDLVPWHVLPTILYPMNIQRNHLSFLCLEETPSYPLILYWNQKKRYLGNDLNVLSLDAMKNMFEIAATNLKLA